MASQSLEFPSRVPNNVLSSSGFVGTAAVRKPASEAAGLPGERPQLDAADLEPRPGEETQLDNNR